MKKQPTDTRARPGFLVLMACVLAAILIPLGLRLVRSAPASAPVESPAPPEPVAANPPAPPAEPAPPPLGPVAQKWGIQVLSVSLAQADSTLDLRYRVIAPEKAAALGASTNMAYLVDRSSGMRIQITPARPGDALSPRSHSQARSLALMMPGAMGFPPPPGRVEPGRTYSILLPNLGGRVKSGQEVAVVVGDAWTGNLTVGQSQSASDEASNN
jgi:hypothetical protein